MARFPESMSAAAEASYGSFALPCLEQSFERLDLVPARERGETFLRPGAMDEIGFEHPLDCRRRVVGFDIAVDFAAALRVRAEAAADMNVIGLGWILVVGALGLRAKQSDVADVMLRAGIWAAGEMNVERGIERHAALTPSRNGFSMALGIGH